MNTDERIPELESVSAEPLLSVIVPARNEESVLGACLASLVRQSEPGFELGAQWELFVVNDDSADGTRAIAEGFEGVVVTDAPLLDLSGAGALSGKSNACWAGAQRARGKQLLFTDADTLHETGDLSRALHEMEKYEPTLLSYSPRQIVSGFWQRAVMPLVFSELASASSLRTPGRSQRTTTGCSIHI